MPRTLTIFQVTNCQDQVSYIGPKGQEWTRGEAIAEQYRAHPSTLDDELERRVKRWSANYDVFPHNEQAETLEV